MGPLGQGQGQQPQAPPNFLQQLMQFLMGSGALQKAAQTGGSLTGQQGGLGSPSLQGGLPMSSIPGAPPAQPAFSDPLAIAKMAQAQADQQKVLQKAAKSILSGKQPKNTTKLSNY